MTLRKEVDFTKGNNISNLIVFALPIMLGALLQKLYHSVDSIVLGQFVGSDALAASNVCETFTNCLVGFCSGMSIGSTVVVAKQFGANNRIKLEDSIEITYTFSIILGIVVSIIGFFATPLMLKFSNINESLSDYAVSYLRIYLSGLVFTIVYNNTAGILRAMGDMTSPFVILAITCTLNIFLDVLFTIQFHWGIAGVAYATIICQFLSVVIGHIILKKNKGFRCINVRKTVKSGWAIIKETTDVGFSAGVQSSIISISNILVWRYVNSYSTSIVAGVGIGHKIDSLMGIPCAGFESAMTTFTSQNIGAKQKDRIKDGIKAGLFFSTLISVVIGLLVYPLAPTLAKIFTSDSEVIEPAVTMMRMIMPLFFCNTIRQVLAGILRAYKHSTQPMLLSIAGMVGVRQIVLALTHLHGQTINDVYLSYPAGWISALLFMTIYFACVIKKLLNSTQS